MNTPFWGHSRQAKGLCYAHQGGGPVNKTIYAFQQDFLDSRLRGNDAEMGRDETYVIPAKAGIHAD